MQSYQEMTKEELLAAKKSNVCLLLQHRKDWSVFTENIRMYRSMWDIWIVS